jgi:hypothetical protein
MCPLPEQVLFFGSTGGVWTQGLTLARQTLSHSASPEWVSVFLLLLCPQAIQFLFRSCSLAGALGLRWSLLWAWPLFAVDRYSGCCSLQASGRKIGRQVRPVAGRWTGLTFNHPFFRMICLGGCGKACFILSSPYTSFIYSGGTGVWTQGLTVVKAGVLPLEPFH